MLRLLVVSRDLTCISHTATVASELATHVIGRTYVLSLSHRLNRLFAAIHGIDEFQLTNEDAATLLSERLGRPVNAAELAAARQGDSDDSPSAPPLARDVRRELCILFGMSPEYLSLQDEIDDDTAAAITQLDTELHGLALYRDHQVEQFWMCSPGSPSQAPATPEDQLSALITALESRPTPSLNPTRTHHLAPSDSTTDPTAPPAAGQTSSGPNTVQPSSEAGRAQRWFRSLLTRLRARVRGEKEHRSGMEDR